jgi:hypothetical protein
MPSRRQPNTSRFAPSSSGPGQAKVQPAGFGAQFATDDEAWWLDATCTIDH